MESSLERDENSLKNELSRGKELARQLQIHLNAPSSSHEARELLVHKIINSYEKTLTMLKYINPGAMNGPRSNDVALIGHLDSPGSFDGSLKSEDSDRDSKDPEVRTESKNRKSMPRWTQQVQVSPGRGPEGLFDDGFSWRKYGQKDILGAKYPRSYYRCTHRKIQGCLATKQIQRSDEDPTLFHITYRGNHTCIKACFHLITSPGKKPEPTTTLNDQQPMTRPRQGQSNNQHEDILLSFKTGLKVITEDLQTQNHNFSHCYNFDFPSTSHVKGENVFVYPPKMENNFSGHYFPPPNISSATLASDYHPVAPSQDAGFEEARNMHGSDSELMDIVSVATTANNIPTLGLDFPFGPMDPFEPSFSFDNQSFFSNF